MSTPAPEPVTVVLPVHNAAARIGPAVGIWHDALGKLGREFELFVVDDGSTDATAEAVGDRRHVRVLRHESRRGFGACLRTALAEAKHPLIAYSSLDYPYTPADLGKLLARIGETDLELNRRLDVVNGCRTGRPVPGFWTAVGVAYRLFFRVACGMRLEPLPGWLGFREHLRSWLTWVVFGNPLVDQGSAFKVFRKSVLDRFPIQSDGDFVHVELVAKATFTTCIMDELPLTPRPDPVPPSRWADFGRVLRNAKFHPPTPPAPPAIVPPCPPGPESSS